MKPVDVFITIDTEVWNFYPSDKENIDSALYGITDKGHFGTPYQLKLFKEYELRANYFVDPLFTLKTGKQPLTELVKLIKDHQQDVQLHIHTEWLKITKKNITNSLSQGNNIKDFTANEQVELIKAASEILVEAGAASPIAFRAGNYGANFNTLTALNKNGILYDTSHNQMYINKGCDLDTKSLLFQPKKINGIIEFPISFFIDGLGNTRHLQLTACSTQEIESVMHHGYNNQWPCIVIVLHSFEAIQRVYRKNTPHHYLDPTVIHRLHSLCKFLADNKDKFKTRHFSELCFDSMTKESEATLSPAHTNRLATAIRLKDQLSRRIMKIMKSLPL